MSTLQPPRTETSTDQPIARDWSRCRLLLLEDDPDDEILIERSLLEVAGVTFDLRVVHRVGEAQAALAQGEFDVILSDMRLPDGTALDLLASGEGKTPPMVVLTGHTDEVCAMETVAAGAQDYLFKSDLQPRFLWNAIRYSILRHDLARQTEALRVSQLQVKDQVLSHVSHELRTPLSAVLQFTSILGEGLAGELQPKQTEYLGIIRRNSLHLKRLIGDLMDVARINSDKFTLQSGLVSVADCLEHARAACKDEAEQKEIGIEVECEDGMPPVLADPDRVLQVLINLVSNAVKFSPEGGRVLVKAASPDTCGFAKVEIHDSGPGIPPEQHSSVFHRLHQVPGQGNTSSRNGLGLGLHIAREIVERSGGDIGVESTEGQGSTFWFTLPNYTLSCVICRATQRDPGQDSLSLVEVDVAPDSAAPAARSLNDAIAEVGRILESCLQSCNDTVLPEPRLLETGARVFATVGTDARGLDGVLGRVRAELNRDTNRLRRWNYTAQVSGREIPMRPTAESGFVTAASWLRSRIDTAP